MLSDYAPVPTLAVTDLQRAQDFYEDVLGFSRQGNAPDGVMYGSGSGRFLVYPSAFAGTNKATAMSLQVPADAFDAEVDALRRKGVTFQTFEAEGISWDDGVASIPGVFKGVWFEDPDGNILNIDTEG